MAEMADAQARISQAANQAKDTAMGVFQTAKDEGFFSEYQTYLGEITMPWTLLQKDEDIVAADNMKDKATVLMSKARAELANTLTLQRGEDVKKGFVFYNVLGFWLGMFESICGAILGGGLLSFVWNGVLSFGVA